MIDEKCTPQIDTTEKMLEILRTRKYANLMTEDLQAVHQKLSLLASA